MKLENKYILTIVVVWLLAFAFGYVVASQVAESRNNSVEAQIQRGLNNGGLRRL